ncbi:MAG: Mpo1-like protein [Brachymonas sp.]|jgi:hypothetical protein
MTQASPFATFYATHFLPEHRIPANRWLHGCGVLLSLSIFPLAALLRQPGYLLAYPFALALPGLLGHRLFEPNAHIGHVRVTRSDAPKLWFWWANYVLAWDLLRGRRFE